MSDKITIRKLASELSISRSTVQRALSGHPSVHQETRQKVLHAAQKKGYTLSRYMKNIAVIVPSLSWIDYLDCLMPCLEREFRRRDFQIEVITQKDISLLKNYIFNGIVSLAWSRGLEKKLPQMFSVPIITINAASNMLESIPAIISDPHGIRLALDYLHRKGCRKILYVSAPSENIPDAVNRLEEFRRFCLETGQDFDSLRLKTYSNEIEEKIPFILQSDPDACFCACEGLAAKLGIQLKKAGLRIPEDISLMGLESSLVNECFSPPITAIRQDFEKIAELAAENMYQAIFKGIPPRGATIPFQLIERESVRQPPRS